MLWNSYERMGEGKGGRKAFVNAQGRRRLAPVRSVQIRRREGEEKRGSPLAELDLGDGAPSGRWQISIKDGGRGGIHKGCPYREGRGGSIVRDVAWIWYCRSSPNADEGGGQKS